MRQKYILLLFSATIILALCAGCTQGGSGGTQTPTPTTSPPTTITTLPPITYSLTPSPTQTIPGGAELNFAVRPGPNLVNPTVIVEFRGGSAQSQVRSMEITFIRPNGHFEVRSLEPRVGNNQEFTVARDEVDRIVVTATLFSGQQFRVMDRTYEYYSHA